MTLAVYSAIWIADRAAVNFRVLFGLIGYTLYAYLWNWLVALEIGPDQPRQWAALFFDHVLCGLCFYFFGYTGAGAAWVTVTASVGHGLRFGERRGLAAAVIGSVSVFISVYTSPYWEVPRAIAWGLASTALIAPIYVTQLVHAIERERRQAQLKAANLEHEVHTDPLTGLLSRRGLEAAWSAASDASGLCKIPIGVVYLDLDGFKAVNDTYGHDAGDEVLRAVGKLLTSALRNTDLVARIGGDEFVVFVRNPTSLTDVQGVAAKAVNAVCRWQCETRIGQTIGASAGIVYSAPGIALASALREADERMFDDKRRRKAACA